MIIALLMDFVSGFVAMVFSILPSVTVADIPFVGEFVDQYFTLAIQYWNSFMLIVPYTQIVWDIFLVVIIPFEVSMLFAKFFFGSRLPSNN